MVAFNKFQQFPQDLANKKHDFSADSFKVMLTNVAPVATNAVKADITDIAAGNGYTAGGTALTGQTSTQTSGTETFAANNVTFTATGAFATFRYAVLYNDTQTVPAKPLIGWFDYASAVTMQNGDTFTVAWNGGASSGSIFTLA